jgi:penicillin V acylase-like amidase (Ntn superfamily)
VKLAARTLAALTIAVAAVVTVVAPADRAGACSAFCLDSGSGPVFGKNYDWDVPDGLVIVNKRGVEKRGLTEENPARWTSLYGSVSFNQYGREMPCGGMNEAGLIVELMWLDETEYPLPDARPALQNLQWIQYHLDISVTVADVIAGDRDVRIDHGEQARVHFLVADSSGACAAVDFVGGEMVVHTGETMPAAVLTNDTYERSASFLATHAGFGGTAPVPLSRYSLDRFVRAAAAVAEYEPDAGSGTAEYAFGILGSVAQGENTQWSIVYEAGARRISYRTRANPSVRTIDVGQLDFGCDSPVLVLDIDAGDNGDVTGEFESYTTAANRRLVENAFRKTRFLAGVPASVLDAIARFPDTTPCTNK